ncbi:MAG TPA: divergent polysaccharide deacetylase family protein, partial [Candidatus Udaeobacter sp.]|nr:divergent polysaccharide deacetylase family protein [Candidatus Udaeobacter sp.]
APISIAVLPGYQGSEKIADAARAAGVEVLLHLPMEPDRYPQVNPGPEAILLHLKPAEMRARMRRALRDLGPVRGIASYMGSRAATDPELVEIVLDETKRQGLFFVDNGVAPKSLVPSVARRLGIPCVTSVLNLDGNRDPKAIARQIAAAVKAAENNRDVVVIGHHYPETHSALRAVLPELKARGIDIVPVSRLVGAAELALDGATSHGG